MLWWSNILAVEEQNLQLKGRSQGPVTSIALHLGAHTSCPGMDTPEALQGRKPL